MQYNFWSSEDSDQVQMYSSYVDAKGRFKMHFQGAMYLIFRLALYQ